MKARANSIPPKIQTTPPRSRQRLGNSTKPRIARRAKKWAKVRRRVSPARGKLLEAIHDIGKELKLTGKLDADTSALIYQVRLKAGLTLPSSTWSAPTKSRLDRMALTLP